MEVWHTDYRKSQTYSVATKKKQTNKGKTTTRKNKANKKITYQQNTIRSGVYYFLIWFIFTFLEFLGNPDNNQTQFDLFP